MANTYTLISSNVLTSSAASVTFSSIPATYTDLVLRISARTDYTGDYKNNIDITVNGSATGYSVTSLFGTGTTTGSNRASSTTRWGRSYSNTALTTSNTFNSLELYFSNYASSAYKVASGFGVTELNSATDNFVNAVANLWQDASVISSINLVDGSAANFVSGSSFYLYGIKNS